MVPASEVNGMDGGCTRSGVDKELLGGRRQPVTAD